MARAQLTEVTLEYFERGHGPETVVLVHGFSASARIWHAVQHALPEDRYRTIAVNNRGAGGSDAPPDEADYAITKFSGDLHGLVTQLGLRDFTLVGHSMGGLTAMQFAVDHPDLPRALLLLDPAGPDGPDLPDEKIEKLIDAGTETRRAAAARGEAPRGLDAGPARFDPEQFRLLMADVKAAPECRLRGSMRAMMKSRIGERVATLPMPIMLAAGDRDAVLPLAGMLDTWRKLPRGSGLQVWHDIGHSPNVECPDAFVALLRQFVEVTVPGRARRG